MFLDIKASYAGPLQRVREKLHGVTLIGTAERKYPHLPAPRDDAGWAVVERQLWRIDFADPTVKASRRRCTLLAMMW